MAPSPSPVLEWRLIKILNRNNIWVFGPCFFQHSKKCHKAETRNVINSPCSRGTTTTTGRTAWTGGTRRGRTGEGAEGRGPSRSRSRGPRRRRRSRRSWRRRSTRTPSLCSVSVSGGRPPFLGSFLQAFLILFFLTWYRHIAFVYNLLLSDAFIRYSVPTWTKKIVHREHVSNIFGWFLNLFWGCVSPLSSVQLAVENKTSTLRAPCRAFTFLFFKVYKHRKHIFVFEYWMYKDIVIGT